MVFRGLVELLDDAELGVVLAHEDAHRRHRHDRFLLAGQIGAAFVPPRHLLGRRLGFSLERWADEEAAHGCGDRRLVGRALAEVALESATPVSAMAFAGLGALGRVAALLEPPKAPSKFVAGGILLMIAATCILALVQVHHLEVLVGALCPN